MLKNRIFLVVMTAAILALSSCQSNPRTPTLASSSTPTQDALHQYMQQSSEAAPKVTSSTPMGGQEVSLSGEITLSFDQPMDPGKTAQALLVNDLQQNPIDGKVTWSNAQTLVFTPKESLQPGSMYRLKLSDSAANAQGQKIDQPYELSFQTTSKLQVNQVFPADNAQNIENRAVITVMFNRPVVPLVVAEEQAGLVNPIEITPEVKGHGEWVNTSLYVFHPESALSGGQTYQVKVKSGLADASGDPAARLPEDYDWSFSVVAPSIASVWMNDLDLNDAQMNVPLNPTLKIQFLQPMDPKSVEANLQLSAAGKNAPLKLKWDEKNTLVEIQPAQLLALKTNYILSLNKSARSADGGSLSFDLKRVFTTVPFPAIASTEPVNQAVQTDPYFRIIFAAPMDFKSLANKVVFSPDLDTKTHSWYNPGDYSLSFYNLLPSTRYTVRILPGMRDPFGNTIRTEKVISFTTRSLSPGAQLMMPNQSIFRSDGPQDFYLRYVNINSISARLYRLTAEDYFKIINSPTYATDATWDTEDIIWEFSDKPSDPQDRQITRKLTLTGQDGKPLSTGFYFLGIQASPVEYKSRFLDASLFFVSSDNVTIKISPGQLLAWVTGLTSGKPSAGVKVKVYDDQNTLVASGVTDADGLFKAQVDTTPKESTISKENYRYAWSVIVDDANHFAYASSQWSSGVSPYDFGLYETSYRPWNEATAYVYTDRPLYRTGQTVYFKGIVRNDDDLVYSLPSQKSVEVVIQNYKEEVYRKQLTLSEIGTFDGTFEIASEAALGSYTLQVFWPGGQLYLGDLTFDVAEYRRPEFQMDVQTSPTDILPGDSFDAGLNASYYSGGGLSNAEVAWTLRSEPFQFSAPEGYSQFSFSNIEYDNWDYYNQQQASENKGMIAEGRGQTDASGKFSTTLKAEPTTTKESQRLIFEATVTDFSGSSVSGQAETVMHQSAVYPGIRSKSYVGRVNEDQALEMVALDWSGKPLPATSVDVEIVERQWFSVQEENDNGQLVWKTSVKENPVTRFSAVKLDDKGLGEVAFKPSKGGVYRAIVTAKDEHGNTAQASTYVWVAGEDYIPWSQSNDRSFRLVADKDTYAPGDTAELLIASPFQGESYALVTAERGHVRKTEVLHLQSNSTLYRLPVSADMAPNIYVSVIIIKGVDETNPRPNFKVGMARLKVKTDQQALNVSLKADPAQAKPGQQVQYTVETTDLNHKPVQAEVSLSLSDLATLSLKEANTLPMMDFFYSPRSLSVITGVAIVQDIEEYNAEISSQITADGKSAGSGGGKGGGYAGVMSVRQDFPDTAFWEARVQTDGEGKATVSVTLPDNLTTWRMDARAVTTDTRVGQTTLDLISSKPLFIRPQTPRFFVAGDQVSLGAAVHNNTDQDLDVQVKIEAGGVELKDSAEQQVSIPARQQRYVTWTVTVPADSQRADLVFSADGGGYSDATRPTLGTLDQQGIPVYRYEVPETVGTSGVLSENGARSESISLPASMDVQQGKLNVELAPSLAAGMTDGLTYLEQYPYLCTEQTISRFLPNVRLSRALRAAGIQDNDLQKKLDSQVNLALQKLYNNQNADGGWGWWPGQDSDTLTSAYALLGLSEARTSDYAVNDQVLSRAVEFLRYKLETFNTSDVVPAEKLNRQAFILYVLARAGSPEVSYTVQLYDLRQSMDQYARAYLLATLHKIDPEDARLSTLVSDLTTAAILSSSGAHWEEKSDDYWNWNTDVRSTAIILSALIETDPQNALAANTVRWLMSNRQNGRWNSTQETAWTLLALTDWVTSTGDLKPDYRYAVAFNGSDLAQGVAGPETVREVQKLDVDVTKMLSEQVNKLVFARDGSAGSLYYTAFLNLWLPVNQVKSLDRGVIISRQYFRPDDLKTPVTEASQGDVLLARLTVVAPHTLHYLLVEDPLPAGMEAVDSSLSTSPQAGQPDTYDWARVDAEGWGWWYFSHIELRDEKVVLSTDNLPAGTYVYTYRVRASTPGEFNVIPPTAQEFYFPDVYGRGDGSQFTIQP